MLSKANQVHSRGDEQALLALKRFLLSVNLYDTFETLRTF